MLPRHMARASSESPPVVGPPSLSQPPEPGDLPRARRVHRALWLVLPVIALAELVGQEVIVARVPTESDWSNAATYVREHHDATDRIVMAPYWADPLLRHELGDLIPLSMAGASDDANYERIYELSIRGHRSNASPTRPADEVMDFGRITLSRWDLGPSTVEYDFLENLRGARVEMVQNGRTEPCPWRRQPQPPRSGLAQGSVVPAERFACNGQVFWVGETMVEDLEYKPRYCIYNHPQGTEPIRTTFRNVPLGERFVMYGGLYNRHEREGTGAPITARVLVDGEAIGRMVHRDLDGWKAITLETRTAEEAAAAPEARGDFTIEVTTPNNRYRTFCWTATIRSGHREGEL